MSIFVKDELAKINVSETLAVVSKQAEVNTKALAGNER